MPGERPAIETPAVTAAGPLPDVCDRVSHDWVLLALQLRVPAPVFKMFRVCVEGFAPPVMPAKFSVPGATPSTGGAVTARVTVTVCGEEPAPAAVTVMVSVYVPAARPLVATASPKLAGAVPDAAERVSHDWVFAAVQLRVPLPLFVMAIFCALGLLPPATPEKLSVLAARCKAGGKFCCGAPPKSKPLTTGFDPPRTVTRIEMCPARFQTRY